MVKGKTKGNLLTHCKYGHEFTEDNIIWRTRDRGRGPEKHRICKICHNRRNKEYRNSLTKEKRLFNNSKVKLWRSVNKDYVRNARLKHSFGITLKEYNDILKSQNNKCLICGKEPNGVNLVVDHNHETGKIRGILCSRCNRSLGWYEKCKEGIETYLNK